MSMPWTLGVIDYGIDIERVWSQSIFMARPLENNLAFCFLPLMAHNLFCPLANMDNSRSVSRSRTSLSGALTPFALDLEPRGMR